MIDTITVSLVLLVCGAASVTVLLIVTVCCHLVHNARLDAEGILIPMYKIIQ